MTQHELIAGKGIRKKEELNFGRRTVKLNREGFIYRDTRAMSKHLVPSTFN